MRKELLPSFLFIAIILAMTACKKDDPTDPYLGYQYFPNDSGVWVQYIVDSIAYDDQFGNDTFEFQLLERIESKFVDNEGRDAQRIERLKRNSDTANWRIEDVWFANLTANTAEKVEENVRFVKLNFPLKLNKTWDGNNFNTEDAQNYEIAALNEPYTINGMSFDSTVTVLQKDFITVVNEDYAFEVYAKNVGLVHKKYTSTELDPNTGEIQFGIAYEYVITDYGQ